MANRRYVRSSGGSEEPVRNERMVMMELAIRLVENFFHRGDEMFEKGDAPKQRHELSIDEDICYKKALEFLRKEFGIGWTKGGEVVKDGDLPEDPFPKSREKAPK